MSVRSTGAAILAARLKALMGEPEPQPEVRARRAVGLTASEEGGTPLPEYVGHFLGRLRNLNDVPFQYLAPDVRLLPAESIRFFILDEAWLDALAHGALAVVGVGTRELARTARALPAAQATAAAHRPFVRDVLRSRIKLEAVEAAASNEPGVVSGFLLRSALVSAWPGMSIRAWASDDPADVPLGVDPAELEEARPDLVVPILRLERLSPAVLLALFDGVPRLVWFEEPHHSVQFGLEKIGQAWQIGIRNEKGVETGVKLVAPMRAGGIQGVVDVSALARALDAKRPLPKPRGAAALALELLQAPSRQRFATSAASAVQPRRAR